MSSEQRWKIDDVLGFLLQLSRVCCLAPVRFVKIRTNTFIYISRPLRLFSVIVGSIIQLCTIYFFFEYISKYEDYKQVFLLTFLVSVVMVIVSYAVLQSGTRIRNYMRCLTKLKWAIQGLRSSEEINLKKWHILIMIFILSGGNNITMVFYDLTYDGSINSLTCIMMLEFLLLVFVQQLFLYFALHVSFLLKIVKEQLQEELSKIINDKDENQFASSTTSHINIPLGSVNKAIDRIGMTEELFPDVLTRERQKIKHRIRQINECYVLAYEVLQELSSSDGFLLFLLLIYCSVSIALSLYDIINFLHKDGSLLSIKLIVHCIKLLVLAIRAIIIVEPCHMAHKNIMKIRSHVSEIICHVTSTSDPIFRVIDGFFHQLVLNDVYYTALGRYKIGRPLITSVIAVATTMLITIFEF